LKFDSLLEYSSQRWVGGKHFGSRFRSQYASKESSGVYVLDNGAAHPVCATKDTERETGSCHRQLIRK
jgi:hypothetical protein